MDADRERLQLALAILSGRHVLSLLRQETELLGLDPDEPHTDLSCGALARQAAERVILDAFSSLDARVRALERQAGPALDLPP